MGFSNDDNQSQVTSPSREAKKAQQETSALTDDLPSNIPSPDLVDALVNSEMCKLSLGEREQVTEDIHGVAEEIKETPEIVSQAQSDLDAELQKLKGKEAYDLALKMNPEYVTNKSFRLRFLRSTLFDAKAAADKMSRHFRMKLDLFGKDKLTKDITQDDLEKEELELLHSGFQRFLPVRDAAGRGVAVWLAQLAPDVGGTPDQVLRWKLRRLFYAHMVFTEDEDIQKRGYVILTYLGTLRRKISTHDRSLVWTLPKVLRAFPSRVTSIHICYDDPWIGPLITLGRLAADTITRVRVRLHYGTFDECTKALQTYGIPTYTLPFDKNGEANNDGTKYVWETRRRLERMKSAPLKIVVPGPYDVMLGRGKIAQFHIGNFRFRKVVEKHKDQYEKLSTFDKTIMAMMIVNSVKESTGRFLKDIGDGWVEADDTEARKKVAHLFRTFRMSTKVVLANNPQK